MEEAFTALLLASSAVTDIFADRIKWLRLPQDENGKPYCIMRRVGGNHHYHSKGASGLVNSRIQLDVYGADYTTAKSGVRAITDTISGYRGTVSGINIQGIFIDNERDNIDEDNDANNRLMRVSIDALIWHT